MKPMITAEKLHISIKGRPILTDVNLTAYGGELTVLLGLNGAGKTTLFRSIIGVLPPQSGQITIEGIPLEDLSQRQRARKISYLVQNTSLPVDLRVFDFVLLGATPHLGLFSLPKQEHHTQVQQALEQLGIAHLAQKSMQNISGGERQTAFLARALVQRADIMLLDEPTAYLDFGAGHRLMDKLCGLVKEQGKTAVAVLHDPNLAIKYADRIVLIHGGTVMAQLGRQDADFTHRVGEYLRQIYGEKAGFAVWGETMFVDWNTQ